MADKTGITWTNATWGPVTGCAKVSPACKFCYAERDWARLVHLPTYAGRAFTDVTCHPERLDQPLRWKRPRLIFVNSMSDLFHEDVPDEFIDKVFAVMALSKQHTFQVLTKRSERMLAYMTRLGKSAKLLDDAARTLGYTFEFQGKYLVSWPIPNVWMGVSVENQTTANERIPLLLQAPAAVRFVSAEPLLEPVSLQQACEKFRHVSGGVDCCGMLRNLDWVIVGGESGPKARLMHPDWARDLRDECQRAGVPFFFKQTGLWQALAPGEAGKAEYRDKQTRFEWGTTFVKTKGGGSELLDGRQHQEWPRKRAGGGRPSPNEGFLCNEGK